MTKKESIMRLLDFFIIALVTTIVVSVILPAYHNIKDEYDARRVLEEAKLIKLSCYTSSLENYSVGDTIFDNSESRIKADVYKEVKDFVETDAEFKVLQINEDGIKIDKMVVIFDGFIVEYSNDKWKVNKVKTIIS